MFKINYTIVFHGISVKQILTNEGSKFKLDCIKTKNSYILLIDDINFKLCLIDFVYLFRHPVDFTILIWSFHFFTES